MSEDTSPLSQALGELDPSGETVDSLAARLPAFPRDAIEHFALAMKRTGRATLIGEATAGAGHFGGMLPLNDNFAAFIPVGRTFDPDTGEGWEGRGVSPDVEVPVADALVEALVRSGIGRDEAVRLSASVHPTASMERRRPRG